MKDTTEQDAKLILTYKQGEWTDQHGRKVVNPEITKSHLYLPVMDGESGEWPGTYSTSNCDQCDGCGWYEGGPTLRTYCEYCNQTGETIKLIPPSAGEPNGPPKWVQELTLCKSCGKQAVSKYQECTYCGANQGLINAFEEVRKIAADAKPSTQQIDWPTEWISVKNKMPNEGFSVLACSQSTDSQFVASYYTLCTAWGKQYRDAWLIETDDDSICVADLISHWMPLPPAP